MRDNTSKQNATTKPTTASTSSSSLYDQLQKNKQERETEFYEETKSESLRGLSDEDAKFLASLQEAQASTERSLKAATEAELLAFKARHEQLERESARKAEEEARKEALKAVKASSTAAAVVKKPVSSKRAMLGITPIKKQ